MRARLLLPILTGMTILAGAGACGEESGGPSEKGHIVAQSGDGQAATVGATLLPYLVLVTDLEGSPMAGVAVNWTMLSGGGGITPTSTTDAAGLASATATLGLAAGVQTVRAGAQGFSGSPVSFTSTGLADQPVTVQRLSGDGQTGPFNGPLPQPLVVRTFDQYRNPAPGVTVDWAVTSGGGIADAPTSTTNALGAASINLSLPATPSSVTVRASVAGLSSAVTFTVFAADVGGNLAVRAGGNNVPDRFSSDLWLADGFGYTGTWGIRAERGNTVKIWQLGPTGAPSLAREVTVGDVNAISDIEVSPDGKWLVATTESGDDGLYAYELTSPGTPVFRAYASVPGGLHTGSLSVIGGKLYAFTAKNSTHELVIFDLAQAASGTITIAGSYPIPPFYGIHDTFVRDGYAFVFAWDEGVYILDVGNGSHGGSPTAPVQVGHAGDHNAPLFGGQTHNGWWFHNPITNEKRYLFIGEEGPLTIGSTSSGDIHVVDVSDLANPFEVAFYRLNGAGVHNLWVDEQRQILYAAFYNGGVVALNVSGILAGNLASRELGRVRPGGANNTFVWGVMLYGGSLYASDMISGFWQLQVP